MDMDEPRFNRALSRLPRADLEPLVANLQLKAAKERLSKGRQLSKLERAEPSILIACGAAHLVWVLWRVLQVWHI